MMPWLDIAIRSRNFAEVDRWWEKMNKNESLIHINETKLNEKKKTELAVIDLSIREKSS